MDSVESSDAFGGPDTAVEPGTGKTGAAAEPGRADPAASPLTWILRGGCVLLLLLFGATVYGLVFSNGLCCADDSYNSTAAKNLADGLGYATTYPITGVAGLTPFDPAISTGPTLVLPAAAVILVFGNVPWAPGFAAATVSMMALLMLLLVLRRSIGTTRALLLTTFFVILTYCATVGIFNQWYALVGEIPAALLTIAGFALLARDPGGRRAVFFCCLLLGLAMNSKTLAAPVAVPAFGYLLARIAIGRGDRWRRSRLLLLGAAGFVLPTALFELWKLISFGWSGYVTNFHDWLSFFTTYDDATGTTPGQKLTSYSAFFTFSLVVLVGAMAVVGALLLIWHRPAPVIVRCYGLSSTGAVLLLGYFVSSAPNNPRYALIGTVLGLFAISCMACWQARPLLVVGLAAICVVPFAIGQGTLTGPIVTVAHSGFTPNARLVNLERATSFLIDHQSGRPFIGGWWGSMSDLEYRLPTAVNFEYAENVPVEQSSGRLLVRNRFWNDAIKTPGFSALQARCNEVLFDAPPYVISRCP